MPTWETLQAITQHVQCIDCGVTLCALHGARECLELELCVDCRAAGRGQQPRQRQPRQPQQDDDDDGAVVFVAEAGRGGTAVAVAAAGETCPICLESFITTQHVAALGCHASHVFHEACIGAWLEKTACCPLCRARVT